MMPTMNPNAKNCVTCARFGFAPDPNTKSGFKLNRECLYKGKITTVNGSCNQWKDPRSVKEKLLKKPIKLKAFTT